MTAVQPQTDQITLTIDGFEVTVPKGTLVIRAAEQLGIQVPRFCDHPLLSPVGACRQCLVYIEINGRAFPKPQASCTIPVENGMVVKTQLTSDVAQKAQEGVMEFLLVNHPLDCPVCDKGGECPLQNQAMSNGRGESRFEGKKRTFEKPIHISSQVLLDASFVHVALDSQKRLLAIHSLTWVNVARSNKSQSMRKIRLIRTSLETLYKFVQ